ncbi:hypothetical protein COS31_05460 [Candidatus Roizmanbacteria bacterium CG02_land_8_20_14_3_00_36_15]|uniref:O-antigen ligase-related domain-containing protein n=1 Tax=Candidatus Roizmanbacteria bacterium CG10_big_fil_rev_8_21_14_0_10_36_26 TaxID=1974851 RepID=A0A2M8KMA8_9BACT|nr:MAG: hypothetical protein COS51_01140 [Candidatus Roizmanbacteria bacterium CG03_land_8_20_14_0_80_36_21]PIV37257.1 MAG: hypothetical protein COS31_05460 [Candidatus Roizmanbacteria bacterium CG02_land_8_20_14_3_00_36_15]PIY70477.1 MAG: hypothetical protein COY89_00960 [Candidatus Roizmanbacteria bacterium CG_4_10_14_0_8_um_filter_36_36]PJA53597.1 MAG: hypothetical protein CO166_01275 [Candidatus Roizmanbacteria bacterium CG_4_9_14_3_um_filter_36_11]PJE61057.1 MAG: hypothetical protein COU86
MLKSRLIDYINKFLKYCFYSLFIFTPLIMSSHTSELFEFNKVLLIYIITTLILFFWLLKMIVNNKIIIKKTPFDIPIFLFSLTQLISTVFSIDRHTSFFGYYGRFNGGLLSLIAYLILYYGFVSNFPDFGERFIFNLLKLSIFSSVAVILWGLPGKFGYDLSCFVFTGKLTDSCWTDQFRPAERLFSTLGQPNWLGAYLTITFFLGLYFFLKTKDSKYLILNTIYLTVNFITLLFTRSRSALLALVLGICFFIVLFYSHFRHCRDISRVFKRAIVLTILLIISVFIFKTGIQSIDQLIDWVTYQKIFVNEKIDNIPNVTKQPSSGINSDVTESGDIRRIVWQGAVELGKRYPWFGSGPETFAYSYYFVRPKEHNLTSEWDFLYNKAHNEYLNYLATTGFVGLGAYLIFILVVVIFSIYNLKAQNSKLKTKSKNLNLKKDLKIEDLDLSSRILVLSLICAYLSILVTNFFGFSTTTINLFFYIIPAIFISQLSNPVLDENQLSNINNRQSSIVSSLKQKVYTGFIILFTFYLLFSIGRYRLADINYVKGDNLYKTGDYQEAAKFLFKALEYKYEHVYEDKLSSVLAYLAFVSSYQKQTKTTKQLIDLSKFYNQKSLAESAMNILYWKTKAKNAYLFYQINGEIDEINNGVDALKHGEGLASTDPKIPYSLAIYYSLLADQNINNQLTEEYQNLSIEEINKTIDLKANDKGYYLLKAQLLKKYHRKEEARSVLKFILNKIAPDDPEAIKELQNLDRL